MLTDNVPIIDPSYMVSIVPPVFTGVTALDLHNFTVMEVSLGESLLTPGLQTTIRVHNSIYETAYAFDPVGGAGEYGGAPAVKNLDNFKGSKVLLGFERPANVKYGVSSDMLVEQVVYRIDRRRLYNNNTEEFFIHACDPTLLADAITLVSKIWKCKTPSQITSEILSQCVGASETQVEPSTPQRDYSADNIHPFQVIYQQSNAALAGGNDPSFVHFMTYNINSGKGKHHFESLYTMSRQSPVNSIPFSHIETGVGFTGPPFGMMSYSFPCDFDLVTDLLNGVGTVSGTGSSIIVNPLKGIFSLLGTQAVGCGLGAGPLKTAFSNVGSAQQQNSCPDNTQNYIQKRQARMRLIDPNHIGFRMTVPWNPDLHAGKVIRVKILNKDDPIHPGMYGSGDYLIVSMKHTILSGGYGTTTVDCVSQTVGQGIV